MATVRKIDALDDVIHQKVRLGVMSSLMASGDADFNFLKAALGVSDGNLSTHLTVLEEHGYISVRKEFVGRKPRTTYSPTPLGRQAFEAYVAALEAIVRAG
ncbi:MAG: transcriptional regulator [Capsulimonadales bacterium]|nr:transcriptional regulator [Capsulimonadales bacterium]